MSRNKANKVSDGIQEYFKNDSQGTYDQVFTFVQACYPEVRYESVSRRLRIMRQWGVLSSLDSPQGIVFTALKSKLKKPSVKPPEPSKINPVDLEYILTEITKKLDRMNQSTKKDTHLMDLLRTQVSFFVAGLKGELPSEWSIWLDHKDREIQIREETKSITKLLK